MNVAEFIERAQNVPFIDKGRDWGGWDCWGMLYVAFRDVFGIRIPLYLDGYDDTAAYDDLNTLIEGSKTDEVWPLIAEGQKGVPFKPRGAQPGDVLLMTMLGRKCHIGMMVNAREMIHVEVGHNAIVERVSVSVWSNNVEGHYRHASLC